MLGLGNSITGGTALSDFIVSDLSEVITWLRAEDDVTTDSGSVARWRDKVGTSDWVSNESGKQPSLVGSGTAARIRFDGGDRMYQKDYDWDSSTDGSAFDFPHDQFDVMNSGGSGGFSLFIVMEVSGSIAQTAHKVLAENHFQDDSSPGAPYTARTDIAGLITITTKGDFIGVVGIDQSSGTIFNNTTSSGTEFPLSSEGQTGLDGTSKFLATIEYVGGTDGAVTLRVDGSDKTLNVSTGTPSGTSFTLGTITVGELGFGMKADMYELVNCSSKLSSGNRDLVENYLMTRHSIS